MTLLQIEEILSDEELTAEQPELAVRCGWCGEIIRRDGKEQALAMCQRCYDGMLEEFLRTQQDANADPHASDR